MSIYQNKYKGIDSLALFNVAFSIAITMDSEVNDLEVINRRHVITVMNVLPNSHCSIIIIRIIIIRQTQVYMCSHNNLVVPFGFTNISISAYTTRIFVKN